MHSGEEPGKASYHLDPGSGKIHSVYPIQRGTPRGKKKYQPCIELFPRNPLGSGGLIASEGPTAAWPVGLTRQNMPQNTSRMECLGLPAGNTCMRPPAGAGYQASVRFLPPPPPRSSLHLTPLIRIIMRVRIRDRAAATGMTPHLEVCRSERGNRAWHPHTYPLRGLLFLLVFSYLHPSPCPMLAPGRAQPCRYPLVPPIPAPCPANTKRRN